MQQNISLKSLNEFAPENFSFVENKNGTIEVVSKTNEVMNFYKDLGQTNLTVQSLQKCFRAFYNFTHREKDGKLIEAPIHVPGTSASQSEIDKAVKDFMLIRVHDVKIGSMELAVDRQFESFALAKQKVFEEEKTKIAADSEPSYQSRAQFLAQLDDPNYGNLFSQIVLQSAFKAVQKDVTNHLHYLMEQHALHHSHEQLEKVQHRLEKYGAGFGQVSGAVKADQRAEAKRNGKEYNEPSRPNKLNEAYHRLMKKTFGER